MYTFLFLVIASFVYLSSVESKPNEFYECEPCVGEECYELPQDVCNYGVTRDPCGRLQCMSGPRQRCGGRDNHLGKCGLGLRCRCGVCKGCSIDSFYATGVFECDEEGPVCN